MTSGIPLYNGTDCLFTLMVGIYNICAHFQNAKGKRNLTRFARFTDSTKAAQIF